MTQQDRHLNEPLHTDEYEAAQPQPPQGTYSESLAKDRDALRVELRKAKQERDSARAQVAELLHELGGIYDALQAGETVTIEPFSVKAARIEKAIAAAEKGGQP